MPLKTLVKTYSKFFKFEDPKIEFMFQEKRRKLDLKFFIACGLVVLAGTLINLIWTVARHLPTESFGYLITSSVLPVFGLVMLKFYEPMGKIAILLGVTFGVASFKGNYGLYFQQHVTENSFAFGNSVGLLEVGLATNIQSFKYRLLFMLAQVFVKFITIQVAYVQMPVSGVALMGTTIFVICLFIMQEIIARKDFNVRFQSQEKLRKFQSLLSRDFPIGVLIMSTDASTVLYSNQFFKNTFEEDEIQIKERVFKNFELESDPETLGIMSPQLKTLTLYEYVETFCPKKLSKQDHDMVVLPAVYKNFNSDIESHYEIKLRLITWDHQPAYAMIFNDVSEKQLVTALKLADQEKDRIIATVSHELRTPINPLSGNISSKISD